MNVISVILFCLASLAVGFLVGFYFYNYFVTKRQNKNKAQALKIIEDAYAEAKVIKKEANQEAKDEATRLRMEADKEIKERKEELKKTEERIAHARDMKKAGHTMHEDIDKLRALLTKQKSELRGLQHQYDVVYGQNCGKAKQIWQQFAQTAETV